MKLGFTGTREGMTDDQKMEFTTILNKIKPSEFHHGDCVGADAEADRIVGAGNRNLIIYVYPPITESSRAFCEGGFNDRIIHKTKPYLERNKDIVDSSEILIACPNSDQEKLRSGTWATIRYAREKKRVIYIIFPTGRISIEEGQELQKEEQR